MACGRMVKHDGAGPPADQRALLHMMVGCWLISAAEGDAKAHQISDPYRVTHIIEPAVLYPTRYLYRTTEPVSIS